MSKNFLEILNYIQLSRGGAVLKRDGRDGIWDLHCGYIARDGSMGGYECGTDGLRSLSPDYVHWWLLMAIGRLIGYQPGKDSNHCQSCSMPHECISRSPKCHRPSASSEIITHLVSKKFYILQPIFHFRCNNIPRGTSTPIIVLICVTHGLSNSPLSLNLYNILMNW